MVTTNYVDTVHQKHTHTHTDLPVDHCWSSGTGNVWSRSKGSAGLESTDDILGGAGEGCGSGNDEMAPKTRFESLLFFVLSVCHTL